MKMISRYEFEDMVFVYGCVGDHTEGYNELSEGQKEVLACAWRDVEHTEKQYGKKDADDYCEEAYEAARSWYDRFIIAGTN